MHSSRQTAALRENRLTVAVVPKVGRWPSSAGRLDRLVHVAPIQIIGTATASRPIETIGLLAAGQITFPSVFRRRAVALHYSGRSVTGPRTSNGA